MFIYPKKYDVIVVGAGHAGIEASLAAARIGCSTLLLTANIDTIGQMSCNPAIGGLAKGHLVREIDALGGEIGKTTDMTGIQFRMLNAKKGPAVRSPRAQCDKKAYQFRMKWVCERQPNLDVRQDQIMNVLHKRGQAYGISTRLGAEYHGTTVILTTGTFLRGLMHTGKSQQSGGRAGDVASIEMSKSLIDIGLKLGRFKTGTPPRILRRSVDYSKTKIQFGDDPAPYFSFWRDHLFHMEQEREWKTKKPCTTQYLPGSLLERNRGQTNCFLTYTTAATAKLIIKNIDKSPMYSGVIDGIGPRYCPSIEDKIVKFSEKERHQIFIEPEGIETDEMYVNGFSTCLPLEVQVELIRTIIGCENAEILRPAYAVEYDYVISTQINSSLETKICRNLYLAGQINGTSGYEEAAAQGIMAGINAARRVSRKEPIILQRNQAYIGVLIDDLVTKGTLEPYRIFTSRAEHRLMIRQDNADIRLSKIGYECNLLSYNLLDKVENKIKQIEWEILRLNNSREGSVALAQLLTRPENGYKDIPNQNKALAQDARDQVEIIVKYEGYIKRQESEVLRLNSMEGKKIPEGFDFSIVPSLRAEARQRLSEILPRTIGQASRISGVSPADLAMLAAWLRKGESKGSARAIEPEGSGRQS